MLVGEDLAAWTAGLDELFARVAGRFLRAEPRWRARAYVRGLLAPLAGKNGWTLAEVAGDTTPDGMQRLLNMAAWDADGVRDDVRAYAVEHLGDPDGVLVVDETGFLKKGVKSAGVQRQYSGTAGRIENCQLGVFCAYTSAKGRTLIDRELYLPKSWTTDRDRCRAAAVPDEVDFATKQVLAQRMLARALDAGVPARWVTADEAFGGDSKFRRWLEQRRIGYVVAVPSSAPIVCIAGDSRVDRLVADAPREAWKRLSCGEGAKGPRLFDWAVATLPTVSEAGPGWRRWLLARRSLTRNAKGEFEIAYYLCGAPTGTPDAELIRVARGPLVGRGLLPDRENRSRARPLSGPPLRHLVPPHHPRDAGAHLPRSDRRHLPKSIGSGLIPLTIGEIKRLLAHLTTPIPDPALLRRWSTWRRRHQHRAKQAHYQRRHTQHHEVRLEY